MKVRSRKKQLIKKFDQKLETQIKSINQPEETPKTCRAFDLLFKEMTPIQELVEDDLEAALEKKPRGRPRKYFPDSEKRDDKHTHKMDEVVTIKPIGPNQKIQMVEMFRFHYRVNNLPLSAALNRIEEAFKITHRQAHQLLEHEF